MSKDLALQQTEWDLHENPESFIPLEFTEEIKPETFGLEIAKATEMVSGLSTTLAERKVLENAYVDVVGLEVNAETQPMFKELRLKIVKNRTQGLDVWKEREKAFYLAGGNFVQAIYNKEIAINKQMEAKLLEGEKYFENLEKEAKRILNEKRIEIIRPYIEDVAGLDFSDFSDENFDDFVLGKKTRYNERIEAEKQEAIRIENERIISELHEKRIVILRPLWLFLSEENQKSNFGLLNDQEFENILIILKERKLKSDNKIKEQEQENAKLKKEAEEKELALQAENNKLQAELQAKKDAETKAENERLAKIEADKKAADKLLKAGQKKQIESWIETFQIEIPEHLKDDKVANDILSKFWSFKSWAKKETENL